MAIYWVDPYVWSPNGGIHGTVSVGNGTYANPWSIANIISSTDMAVLETGDEIRIKGLPESEFFNNPASTLTLSNVIINSVSYTSTYTLLNTTSNRVGRAQADDGEIFYFTQVQNALYTTYGVSTWYPAVPTLNAAYGYYAMNTRYVLSNTSLGTTTRTLFNNTNANITITAGWTSETVNDGMTIWFANSTSVHGSTTTFGTLRSIIDAPNLIIGLTNASQHVLTVNADTLSLKALAGPNYAASSSRFNLQVGISTTGSHTSTCGNVNIPCAFWGGSWSSTSVSITSSNTNFDHTVTIPFISGGFSGMSLSIARRANNPNLNTTIYLRKLYSDYALTLSPPAQAGNTLIVFNNDWEFIAKNAVPMTVNKLNFSEVINPTTKKAPFPNGIIYNVFGNSSLTSPAVNQNYLGPQVGNLLCDASSILKLATVSTTYKTAFKNLQIINPGETSLETLTSTPLTFTTIPIYGSPWKVNIFNETNTFKQSQLLSPTTTGRAALVYNSNNFGGKLTWKITGASNGLIYADTFSLPLPSYASNNISFSTTFDTSNDPGANVVVRLHGFSQSRSNVIPLANVTGTYIGNVVYANTIMTSSFLTGNLISSLFAVVEVTKTSNSNAEIAFNTMTVSQV